MARLWTEDEDDRAAVDCLAGETCVWIGRALGRSPDGVYRRLQRLGYRPVLEEHRPPSPGSGRRRRPGASRRRLWTAVETEWALRARADGRSNADIGAALGRSLLAVAGRLRRLRALQTARGRPRDPLADLLPALAQASNRSLRSLSLDLGYCDSYLAARCYRGSLPDPLARRVVFLLAQRWGLLEHWPSRDQEVA